MDMRYYINIISYISYYFADYVVCVYYLLVHAAYIGCSYGLDGPGNPTHEVWGGY